MSDDTTNYDGRIGEKMEAAVQYVAKQPRPSKHDVAKTVGPHGSTQYGYHSVDRCISRGLIEIESDHEEAEPRGKGAVVLTYDGYCYCRNVLGIEPINGGDYTDFAARFEGHQ